MVNEQSKMQLRTMLREVGFVELDIVPHNGNDFFTKKITTKQIEEAISEIEFYQIENEVYF